jgi:SagB-type dehydrogenase family enzyme
MNTIICYHEETKHHFNRYARSAGSMDWSNQPDPFRFYEGKTPIPLPFLKQEPTAGHQDLYLRKNNVFQPINFDTVGGFLELSLALSAWKAVSGSQWSIRINPSSGNLHPTEAHLMLPVSESKAGLYHYNPLLHAIEERAEIPKSLWQQIQNHFKTEGFFVGLSSIFWRESWKYGERAFRYCCLDVGHALACLSFAANLFGWRVVYLNVLSEKALNTILGFDRVQWQEMEREHPDLLCFVCNDHHKELSRTLPHDAISEFSKLSLRGTPNVLSHEHVNWESIYEAAAFSEKPETPEKRYNYGNSPLLTIADSALPASKIIRQRRSGVAFHPEGAITKDSFISILDKTLPRNACAPFDAEIGEPCVNLLLFVHNVKGLESGMYFLIRDKNLNDIKAASHPLFIWKPIEDNFPLYLLQIGDFRKTATRMSCHQDIAGDSAFSVGMIARFREIAEESPWKYRRLFWECGMIGQVLYLEAEAYGLRGTGIGCYFDDAVHKLMGFEDNTYQSMYHFTIGTPIEDRRLFSYPPYHHLKTL